MAKREEINDRELFDYEAITWTMLRTKNASQITMIARSETPINAMALFLSLEARLEQWRQELFIFEVAPEVM